MARSSRTINLKDGFYIEILPKFGGQSIMVRRETDEELKKLMVQYQKSKNVNYIGEVKDGKPLDPTKRKRFKRR